MSANELEVISNINSVENESVNEESHKNKKLILIEKFIKRFVDIVAGLVGIIILIPLTIGIYIARKILKEDEGPIFYDQLRIGKDGKHFKIYKYRTMVVGADEKLQAYLDGNEDARKEFEKNQKLKNDPRITKLGNFLRKTSVDELPQLINVLKGEMSLVGPRPIVDREVPLFGDKMEIVHSVKPGITGYWAVNGRSDTSYEDRIEMETFYAENYSLKLDLQIILKTVNTVLKKEGAI